jgi:hypothetical protein
MPKGKSTHFSKKIIYFEFLAFIGVFQKKPKKRAYQNDG